MKRILKVIPAALVAFGIFVFAVNHIEAGKRYQVAAIGSVSLASTASTTVAADFSPCDGPFWYDWHSNSATGASDIKIELKPHDTGGTARITTNQTGTAISTLVAASASVFSDTAQAAVPFTPSFIGPSTFSLTGTGSNEADTTIEYFTVWCYQESN